MTKNQMMEFLELNWKEKCTLLFRINSGNIKKCKDNYDANCFEIKRRFIINQGKKYIFLVSSYNGKVYAFNPLHVVKDGLYIVSKNNKSILIGFKCKRISDFLANQ